MMKEASTNIKRVAMNLTTEQFKGYCLGMEVDWLFRAISETKGGRRSAKKAIFWGSAFDTFKGGCRDSIS